MIARYSLPEMSAIWSDVARLARWTEIEVLAVEAWAELGAIPREDAAAIRERAPAATEELLAAALEREKVTDHDLAAFVDVVQERIGAPEGAWVHYGLTSSDVLDTALAMTLVDAADLLIDAATGLVSALARQARRHRTTPMMGRSHGIHAEPTTFGSKLALFCLQADRDRERLRRAREAVAVGKLSGPVGTYSNVDPGVEASVCQALGLSAAPATQVVTRDRHAEFLWACASVGATLESLATEIRHLARTEVAEVAEPFAAGQKGSSAMPHKRNPWRSETVTGLARLLRGYLGAGLEDVALWHERDISHSSVERVALPDASHLAYFGLRRMATIVDGMQVNTDRMAENLEASFGLCFSQPVLLALVQSGMTRDAAYRVVQRNAHDAWEQRKPFRTLLESDPEMTADAQTLDDAFSLERALSQAGRAVDALDQIDTADPAGEGN
jgi:adenylosuccinate lyase